MATDTQIDDLIEELRRLIPTLQNLGTTSTANTSTADRGINRLVTAIGMLSAQMSRTSRSVKNQDLALQKFTARVDQATDSQEELAKAADQAAKDIADAASAQAELARRAGLTQEERDREDRRRRNAEFTRGMASELEKRRLSKSASSQIWEAASRTGGSLEMLKSGFFDLGKDSVSGQIALRGLAAATQSLTQAFTGYTAAVYKGERGVLVGAKAFSDLVKPLAQFATTLSGIISVASFFVPALRAFRLIAPAIGLAAAGATKFAEFTEKSAEQADALIKSFREISTVGGATAGGIDDIFQTIQTLGMTTKELDRFNQLVMQNAKALGLMGASAGQGAKRFAEVAGGLYKSRLGAELEMLGITAHEQREATLSYMMLQAKSGQLQFKSTQQLVQESAKFAKELDLAAQLTGQTRKEQQQAREAAMAEVRFRAAMIDAIQRGDKAEVARLETAQRAAALAKGFGDERGFTGILQAAAGRGALTTPEAVAAEMTYRVSQLLQEPNPSDARLLELMGQSIRTQQQQLAGINRYAGQIDVLQTGVVPTADLALRQQTLIEEAAKAGFTGPDALTRFMETEQGRRIMAGGRTRAIVQAERAQQSQALILERTVDKFGLAVEINSTATDAFESAVNKFGEIVGTVPRGGTPRRPAGAPPATGARTGTAPVAEDYLTRLAQLESGNRNIPTQVGGGTSSAFGLYQITKTTFDSLVAQAAPGSPLKGKTFEDMKADVNLQRTAVTALTEQNMGMLARRGLSTSDAAKYMSHVLGYPIAARILESNPNVDIRKVVPAQSMANNPAIFKNVSTVGDAKRKFSDITGGGGYRYGGIATGPKSGYETVLHGTEAVIPLADGNSIKVEMPDFAQSLGNQMTALSGQINRLDELISLMRAQNGISTKILQATQN